MTDPNLLDTAEAAKYLGVRPGTLEVWRSTGRYNLTFVKIGRTVRYRRAQLDEWLVAREASSTAGQSAEKPKIARRHTAR